MDSTRFAALPAQLRTAADAIAALPDVTALPPLCSVTVEWDEATATLTLAGQLQHATAADTDKIDQIRRWAMALDGDVHLGEEVREPRPGWCWRNLSAGASLPDGTQVEIWTHLRYRAPERRQTAPDASALAAI